jgi:hypothetical protein
VLLDDLCAIPARGACTDAERRAAGVLEAELTQRGHEAWTETHWLRPHWAVAVALGSLLGVAGSLLSITVPLAGVILGGVAALGLALEAAGRSSPLRLVSGRRATQDVVSLPARDDGVMLVVAAPYDAPRRGLLLNDRWRALAVRTRGVRGWLALGALVVAGASAARLQGVDASWLGAIQLVPTVAMIGALAASLDIASSEFSPGADTASAAAIAVDVFDELVREAPASLAPGLLLYGAGGSGPLALRAQLKRERLHPRGAVVLEIGPSTGGTPAWRARHTQLKRAAELAAAALELPPGRRPRPTRGAGRLPTIRIACLDERGLAARSHQPDDTPEHADPAAATAALDLALGVADALDAQLPALDHPERLQVLDRLGERAGAEADE